MSVMMRRCAAQRGALRRLFSASTQAEAAEAAPTHLPEVDPADMLGKSGAYVWLRTTRSCHLDLYYRTAAPTALPATHRHTCPMIRGRADVPPPPPPQ